MAKQNARGHIMTGLALTLAMVAGSANAINLQQAYVAALRHDPVYRMSYFENEAAKENRKIGRAGLLPGISGNYTRSRNRADQTQVQGPIKIESHPRYESTSATVQLRQPLFSLDAWARYKQGVAQAKEGAARFEQQTDEVAVRVTAAYIEALYAADQVSLVKAQRDAYEEQMKVNKRFFDNGEGTKTDMLETQARRDLAEAQLLEAQDNLTAARNTLEGVIGAEVDRIEPLGANFRMEPLETTSFDAWRAIALANNPDLKAGRLAIEVAHQEVNKARAGHAPRLDFLATYSKGDSESLTTLNQENVNRSVGIQLNVPIYQGGQVSAVSRQAVAYRERAREDLERRTNLVMVELRKAHSIVLSSVAKVDALVKAVDSGRLLMTATEQSIQGGVRINLDLLNAQQQLAQTERDLAQARYTYVLGTLRLKAAAGLLTDEDVFKVAKYFE